MITHSIEEAMKKKFKGQFDFLGTQFPKGLFELFKCGKCVIHFM
jgi:hypothetical protein